MKLSERLEYRLPYTKEVMRALQDESFNLVGINCGKIRGGDTVTTKKFIERVKQEGIFEEVVMTVVSPDPDLRRIQGEIADMLELNLENGSLFERAEVLRARMSKDSRRVLVILADVREMLDLEAIGIPYADSDTGGRCKIIFMSGLVLNESSIEMRDQSNIEGPIAFESRKSTVKDIMEALTEDQINPVVICGKGGIGKTTLVKEVGHRAKAGGLFDEVVMAVFTKEPDLKLIQKEIAGCLGLALSGQSLSARANRLRQRLSGDQRVLVILDNVSTPLNLEELGIPFRCDKKGCKVLVLSQNQDISSDMRGTKKDFPIAALPEQEAWSLFRQMAGSYIESPELRTVAQEVLRECAGLPIAIATIGRALQHESNKQMWYDALRHLRKPCPVNIPGTIREVYRKIELSYECLGSEEAKSFFLLCCIYPESSDMPVIDLVRFGIGLELFKGIDSKTEARNHIETLVGILKTRLLLLDSDKEGCVKMHDIVHSVGLSIVASKGWGIEGLA